MTRIAESRGMQEGDEADDEMDHDWTDVEGGKHEQTTPEVSEG